MHDAQQPRADTKLDVERFAVRFVDLKRLLCVTTLLAALRVLHDISGWAWVDFTADLTWLAALLLGLHMMHRGVHLKQLDHPRETQNGDQ